MSKLTWKDLVNKKIVIHTPTEDIMKLVIDIGIKALNIKNQSSYDDCNNGHTFYFVKEGSCVKFSKDNGCIHFVFGSKSYYEGDNYKVVKYEEVKHLFEDYIGTIKTKEMKYLAKIKLTNEEEGYFREEWNQEGHWLSPVEEIEYADTYTNSTALKEILNIYKEEIKEYKIIKQTTTTTKTFAFIE